MHGRDVATGIIVVSIVDSAESAIKFARSFASVNTDSITLSSSMVSCIIENYPRWRGESVGSELPHVA